MNFKSNYFYNSVYDIDYKLLKSKGITALIYDIDNTLAGYDSTYPDEKLLELFRRLKDEGFKIFLLSNNKRSRVSIFSEKTGLPYKGRAMKPLKLYIRKAMKHLGSDEKSTALIGDQIFTDVWGANRAGITSVLVSPLTDKDDKFVALKRRLEKFINKNN